MLPFCLVSKELKNDGVDVEEKSEIDDVGVEEGGVDVLDLCSRALG